MKREKDKKRERKRKGNNGVRLAFLHMACHVNKKKFWNIFQRKSFYFFYINSAKNNWNCTQIHKKHKIKRFGCCSCRHSLQSVRVFCVCLFIFFLFMCLYFSICVRVLFLPSFYSTSSLPVKWNDTFYIHVGIYVKLWFFLWKFNKSFEYFRSMYFVWKIGALICILHIPVYLLDIVAICACILCRSSAPHESNIFSFSPHCRP